ncbi:MAG: molybdopterin-dependent oxidoreductase, partial [bacterium]
QPKEKPYSDDFLIREDKNPNTKGASLLGYGVDHEASKKLLKECVGGGIELLIIFDHDLETGFEAEFVDSALTSARTVIFVGSNANATSTRADFILPACTYFEKDGTFTNYAGRVQKANKAIDPLGDSLPAWTIIRNLSRKIEKPLPYFEAEDVFKDMAKSVAVYSGMSYEAIGDQGMVVQENGKLTGEAVVVEEEVMV